MKYIFIDEKDAEDVPLTLGKAYFGQNDDGQLVDIYDDGHFVGTYAVERFEKSPEEIQAE